MEWLNNMIIAVNNSGLTATVYKLCHLAGFIANYIFAVFYGRKWGLELWKNMVLSSISAINTYLLMNVLYWAETGFQSFGGGNIIRSFAFAPFMILPFSLLLRVRWNQICNILFPAAMVQISISRIGCVFAGCCRGYPMDGGLLSLERGETTFPMPIVETLVLIVILVLALVYARKTNYSAETNLAPMILMLYGFTRVLLEFGRDNEKIFLGMSSLAFWALFTGLVGVGMHFLVKYNNRKIIQKGQIAADA